MAIAWFKVHDSRDLNREHFFGDRSELAGLVDTTDEYLAALKACGGNLDFLLDKFCINTRELQGRIKGLAGAMRGRNCDDQDAFLEAVAAFNKSWPQETEPTTSKPTKLPSFLDELEQEADANLALESRLLEWSDGSRGFYIARDLIRRMRGYGPPVKSATTPIAVVEETSTTSRSARAARLHPVVDRRLVSR